MKKGLCLLLFLTACGSEAQEFESNNQRNNGNSNNTAMMATNNTTTNATNNASNTGSNNNTTSAKSNGSTGSTNAALGLSEIFEVVFSQTGCITGYCHGGAIDGLVLSDASMSIEAMVNVTSIRPACGLTKIVVPGEPEQSLLWHRVRPSSLDKEECGAKMPQGTEGLSEENAKLVYDWIASGATL